MLLLLRLVVLRRWMFSWCYCAVVAGVSMNGRGWKREWRTGGWLEDGWRVEGAAKVKVEATPPPPHHRTLLYSCGVVAYFANMTDVPSTLHSLANVFSIRSTRNRGQGVRGPIFYWLGCVKTFSGRLIFIPRLGMMVRNNTRYLYSSGATLGIRHHQTLHLSQDLGLKDNI